ncbi:putative RNA-directed DNA polymerase from transposon X-element, partial [Stegodyphus mimosarum]
MATLVSWNSRGFHRNLTDIKDIINAHHPVSFALQETNLKPEQPAKLRRFSFVRKDNIASERASGGVGLLTSLDYPSNTLSLTTSLQVVAVQINFNVVFSVVSVYLPPNEHIDQERLNELVKQLPEPLLLIGDFNGHSPLWGSKDTNSRGRQIEQLIEDHSLCLLNTGQDTYFHEPTRTFHAICSPSLLPFCTFSVSNDLYSSDHYPIFVSLARRGANSTSRPVRFIVERANWDLFSSVADLTEEMVENVQIDDAVECITNVINQAAVLCIPRTSGKLLKYSKPWWNRDCQEALQKQRKAWGIFRRYPTLRNYLAFKRAKANARKVRRQSQRDSWISYVSRITSSTPSKRVWERVKKACGIYKDHSLSFLEKDGRVISSIEEIANTIGETFSAVSSSRNYSPAFLVIKQRSEKNPIAFNSSNSEPYNRDFTMLELKRALFQTRKSCPGLDGVSYDMLKHLSYKSLNALLTLYNRVWKEHTFPSAWRRAVVIPIAKPGKDSRNPSNYRPIALTSCICKLFEKMVNSRLVYFLEKNSVLSPYQSGFRKGRTTIDNMLLLETSIRKAFLRRNHLVSIFFDIEKAYDKAWRYGILRDLHDSGLRGNLPFFIQNFLNARTFQVKIGSVLSKSFEQEEGVPQGSVLSVTLFSLKINSVLKELPRTILGSLYVDDLQISCRGADMRHIERQLQIALNKIHEWSVKQGFTFSEQKTVCVHFCRKRGLHPEPELYLNGSIIPVAPEAKFLGMVFDQKLTFLSHVLQLRKKCMKALNILKVLANTSWGADRCSMLRIYRALVRSRLDYGSVIYGSARSSVLLKLDPVHHQALRICSGAFSTSPLQSLYVDCYEPSLRLRREQLSLLHYFSILSQLDNPSRLALTDNSCDTLFNARPSCVPPFSLRIRPLIEELSLSDISPQAMQYFEIPPWEQAGIQILEIFPHHTKKSTNNVIYTQLFADHRYKYQEYVPIYTDGSKSTCHVGTAFVIGDHVEGRSLHHASSVLTAELTAIYHSLLYVSKRRHKKFIVYSDSYSALKVLEAFSNTHNPVIFDILKLNSNLTRLGFEILYCWIPGHTGIKGNERADVVAKSAVGISSRLIPISDISSFIKQKILEKWQQFWDVQSFNKLKSVKHRIELWHFNGRRKEEVLLTRLRIGHTRMTHKYLLNADIEPLCSKCGVCLTVRHLLIECPSFNSIRQKYFNSCDLPLDHLIGREAMGPQFLFMDDNAPPHRTVTAEELLESEDIEHMD